MNGSTFVYSTSSARRLEAAQDWLLGRPSGEMTLLTPTRGAGDDLLRSTCRVAGGWFGVHRTTPYRLAADLATPVLSDRGLAPVGGLSLEALAARTIAIAREREQLDYFLPVANAPGLARALARTLGECRLYEVAGREIDASGEPGRDLVRLQKIYDEVLEQANLVDRAGLLRLAINELEQRASVLPLLVLDVSPISPLEQRFFRALWERAPETLATLPAKDVEGLAAWQAISNSDGSDLDQVEEVQPNALERLRRRVFLSLPTQEEPEPEDESLLFLSAPGEGRECVEIARRIHGITRETDLTFDQMAILLRHEGYLPLVEEALRRAEIPAWFTRGTRRPHPSGRAFLSLLTCAVERLSASRFAEYLSLGQSPIAQEKTGAPVVEEVPWVEPVGEQLVFKTLLPVDEEEQPETDARLETEDQPTLAGSLRTPRHWEKLLVDAAVVEGKDRWAKRLNGLKAELQLQLRHVDDGDAAARERLQQRLDELKRLASFALPIITALDDLPSRASWGDWLDALRRLATLTLRQPEQVLTALNELQPMAPIEAVGLEEVLRVLEERLTQLRIEPRDRRYGKVFVGTLEEARGRAFEVVFLPGLAEGVFPRRAFEDPLLLDVYRSSFSVPLPTQKERFERERLLLRLAAGAARRKLVISYPNLDTLQGRSRVPSFYALDVLRAAEGHLPDQRQLEKRAAAESASLLGWPAPKRAELAIDDSEYDLAVLDRLLRLPLSQTTSRGRFLIAANEHLGRALRIRWQRWRRSFSAADGLVAPQAEALKALAEHRLADRSYSPTALQHYAACPYRFLLYSIYRLRPREEAVALEQLDPLTRGSLFHEVQYELYLQLEEQNLLPMRKDYTGVLRQMADEVLDRVAAEYREELAPAIERVWESEIEGLRVDLHGWIRGNINARGHWRPAFFELSFGLGARTSERRTKDERSVAEPVAIFDGYRLRGAIDLVESDDQRDILRVTDHKTGKAKTSRHLVVGGGEVLQPMLYALVAETLLEKGVEAGRLYYCTRRGDYRSLEVPVTKENRKQTKLVLDTIDHAIRDGFLPALPNEKACTWCDFRPICGPREEARAANKRKEFYRPLSSLRRMG